MVGKPAGTWKNSIGAWYNPDASNISTFFKKSPQIPTNVTHLSRAIKTSDTRPTSPTHNQSQIVFYQAGVGTSGTLFSRLLGGTLGTGLTANVQEAYAFIATNYVEGDEVFLIGFSRGAYTARAVGGLIGDMGLLTKESLDKFYDVYTDWNLVGKKGYKPLLTQIDPDFELSSPPSSSDESAIQAYLTAYRNTLQKAGYTTRTPVTITALGVFETVGALGIPISPFLRRLGLPYALHPYRFYDTALSSSGHVRNAFQALALDERRSAYTPTIWEKPQHMSTSINLKQTWFPGVHSSVGGGYTDTGLSNISLAWMMSQLEPWIDFDAGYLQKQIQQNVAYLKQEDVPKTGLEWAASQLQNTAAGIRGWLGTAWRTPGRYFRVDRATDRPLNGQPLRDTNEKIHISVRSRERTGGLDDRNRVVGYRPQGLEGYVLQDPSAELGKGLWKYEGKDTQFEGKVLVEDELGVFEREVLGEFRERRVPGAM